MSTYQVDYTGEPATRSARVETPLQAARAIINGFIPDNLPDYTVRSSAFRDATLAELLNIAANEGKFEDVLNTLCGAMREARENSRVLSVYSEYTAGVAFAWEHQELAARVIMRNDPQNTSPFLWTIVSAIKKNMPSVMFAAMVMSMGSTALSTWQQEAVSLFGLSPESQGLAPATV